MNDRDKTQLGKTLWGIADDLRGAMNADDFRDYMLSFLFLRYLSDNYEVAAEKELGRDYPQVTGENRRVPLAIWYANGALEVIENSIQKATIKHNEFLEELGLPQLPSPDSNSSRE
jgi:type I restriction enzyme M protein